MLEKLLSGADKIYLREFLEILSIADKPLLWDGKRKEEISSETDLRNISIQKGAQETAFLKEIYPDIIPSTKSDPREAVKENAKLKVESDVAYMKAIWDANKAGAKLGSVERRLLDEIKTFPLQSVEDPEIRLQVATNIFKEMLGEMKFDFPSIPKIMLYELMSMSLCNGAISSIEWALLKEFQHHHQLEDFIFEDILERAETTTKEVSKTISIILE